MAAEKTPNWDFPGVCPVRQTRIERIIYRRRTNGARKIIYRLRNLHGELLIGRVMPTENHLLTLRRPRAGTMRKLPGAISASRAHNQFSPAQILAPPPRTTPGTIPRVLLAAAIVYTYIYICTIAHTYIQDGDCLYICVFAFDVDLIRASDLTDSRHLHCLFNYLVVARCFQSRFQATSSSSRSFD